MSGPSKRGVESVGENGRAAGMPFIPAATRSLLALRDSKLRRCSWCGDWQYGQSPCTACHTPAQPIAAQEAS